METNVIILCDEDRKALEAFAKNGVHSAHLITRARVILALDRSNKKDHLRITRISDQVNISRQAIYNIRDEFLASASVEEFLVRKKRETPPVPTKITGETEALIIATACSKPPEGYAKWSVRLLANRLVELNISYPTIHRLLKKRNISLI